MASKYQREYDGYARFGRWDRATAVVAAATAAGDPVVEAESAPPADKPRKRAARADS